MIDTVDPRSADIGRIPADCANKRIPLPTGVTLVVALGLASFDPRPLVLPVLSSIVLGGALATTLAATLLPLIPVVDSSIGGTRRCS